MQNVKEVARIIGEEVIQMRLIDADALMETLGVAEECEDCQYRTGDTFIMCSKSSDFVKACGAIINAPTVGSTPVKLSVLYLCDPDKNTECKKTMCYRNGGECFHTVHKKYRRFE